MLPPSLTFNTLALSAENKRPSIVLTIPLTKTFKAGSPTIQVMPVKNLRRMTYEKVGEIIDGDDPKFNGLRQLWIVAVGLSERRRSLGGLSLCNLTNCLLTDEDGKLRQFEKSSFKGHTIVQEFMILANATFAEHLAKAGISFLFRNHRPQTFADRTALLNDLDLVAGGGLDPNIAASRAGLSMQPAALSTDLGGHFGLNLPVYGWFTSPIRRYADLVNQRIILANLGRKPSPYTVPALNGIADTLNTIAAIAAADKSESLKRMAEFRALETLVSGKVTAATMSEFGVILKSVCLSREMSQSFLDDLETRLADDTLTGKHLARLLTFEGERAGEVRDRVIRHLMQGPHRAPETLVYFQTTKGWGGCAFTTIEKSQNGSPCFTSVATVTVSPDQVAAAPAATSSTKKLAEQRALTLSLAAIFGVNPEEGFAGPAPYPAGAGGDEAARPPAGTEGRGDPGRASKSTLNELCQRKRWPPPEYSVTSSGPHHAPLFHATVHVKTDGEDVSSPAVAATTKQLAEHNAAAALLSILSIPVSNSTDQPAEAGEPVGGNPSPGQPDPEIIELSKAAKSALNEMCQRKRWSTPEYTSTPSGADHTPVFHATVQIKTGAEVMSSPTMAAPTKKLAEHYAAAALLRDLVR